MIDGPILLIDDDEDECELIGDALTHLNVPNKLLCFANGAEALGYLRTTTDQPFLIFSDINMPQMGGLELRRIINEDAALRRKSIPFIFLTTSATQHSVAQAYEMSVQGFFEKGYSMEEICGQLAQICNYWKRCLHPNKWD